MTRTLAIALVGAALVLGVAYAVNAQQMDGTNCEWAYKKLQQHKQAGACREQTTNRGLDGATDHGKTARKAEQADRK